jgi:hypothetical protein
MDKNIIKQLRRALIFESFFSGASSLSKMFDETENELEDVISYIDKKVKGQKLMNSNIFKNGKQ